MGRSTVQVIDLSQCTTPESLASAVSSSLSSAGFLFIRGHGLERQVDELFEISENFFANETEEEKRRAAYADNKGYTRISQETLDPTNPAPDLKEGFNIGFISDETPPQPSHPLPSLLHQHVEKLQQFQHACFSICQRLLEAIAISLDLEPTFFTNRHHEGTDSASILRLLHYIEISPGQKVDPNRAGAHSDYGSLTLLFQRAAGGEGLQILPSTESLDDGQWQDVGVVENAMLVNIGDALELWTGAKYKSTLHRVVLPIPLPAEGIPERFSIAYFNQPSPQASLKTVVPVSSISANDLARMERKGVKPGTELTANEHLKARLASTYKLS
ncbi:isopenicillin N synthase family dioxygenase [Sporobolomyces salmoneus]|uniref:isopenicillin N synthase family dioxygenase n=1 Tax=Sporobolomyces salmoneus TaxID=183962 RepID=UPI00316BF96B